VNSDGQVACAHCAQSVETAKVLRNLKDFVPSLKIDPSNTGDAVVAGAVGDGASWYVSVFPLPDASV